MPCDGYVPMLPGAKRLVLADIAVRADTPIRTREAALEWIWAAAQRTAEEKVAEQVMGVSRVEPEPAAAYTEYDLLGE